MKKLRNILLLAVMGLLFMRTSCRDKIIPSKHQIYKGRIMASCGVPAANFTFYIECFHKGWHFTTIGNWSENVTTDANGYFTFTNQHNHSPNIMAVDYQKFLESFPSGSFPDKQTNDLGDVFLPGQTVSFVIRLEVKKSYTNQDTLVYYDWNYPQNGNDTWIKKIAGPFQSGIIDTVKDAVYMSFPLSYNTKPEFAVNYYVNDYDKNTDANVTTPFCIDSNQVLPEAVLMIK